MVFLAILPVLPDQDQGLGHASEPKNGIAAKPADIQQCERGSVKPGHDDLVIAHGDPRRVGADRRAADGILLTCCSEIRQSSDRPTGILAHTFTVYSQIVAYASSDLSRIV